MVHVAVAVDVAAAIARATERSAGRRNRRPGDAADHRPDRPADCRPSGHASEGADRWVGEAQAPSARQAKEIRAILFTIGSSDYRPCRNTQKRNLFHNSHKARRKGASIVETPRMGCLRATLGENYFISRTARRGVAEGGARELARVLVFKFLPRPAPPSK